MSERAVKTTDLPPNTRPIRWAFCGECYGNRQNDKGQTTLASGDPCPTCDGSGTLWLIPEQIKEQT